MYFNSADVFSQTTLRCFFHKELSTRSDLLDFVLCPLWVLRPCEPLHNGNIFEYNSPVFFVPLYDIRGNKKFHSIQYRGIKDSPVYNTEELFIPLYTLQGNYSPVSISFRIPTQIFNQTHFH